MLQIYRSLRVISSSASLYIQAAAGYILYIYLDRFYYRVTFWESIFPSCLWSHITVDFLMGSPPYSEGSTTVLTITDHISKAVLFITFPKLS